MSNQAKVKTREELVEQYIRDTVKYIPDQERVRQHANSLGLNPYTDEIVYTPRWDSKNNRAAKGSLIIPFDIILAKAWDTGEFLGVDTEEVYDKNVLVCVKAVGKRHVNGHIATLSFNAYMVEYKPKKDSGFSPWINMPTVMLRKCAIANVVRQLFADSLKLSSLYISEEMDQAQDNNYNTNSYKEVPKGVQQKVTNNTSNIDNKDKSNIKPVLTNEEKAEISLKRIVDIYYILVEKGEQALPDKQIDAIIKSADKNLPNVKNASLKNMLEGLAMHYSIAAGIENPLDDRSPNMAPIDEYPEDMFNDVEHPFVDGGKPINEKTVNNNFEDSEFPNEVV